MHHLENQVYNKFGVVGPLYQKNGQQNNYIPDQRGGLKFLGVVDHFIDKKRANNTKFDTNLTFQVVYNID
jgi:hypothetical protein